MEKIQNIYFIVVGFSGPIIIFIAYYILKNIANLRKFNMKNKHLFRPIDVKSSDKYERQHTKQSALHNLNVRFTIIKSTVLVTLISIWLLLLVFPLLSYIPATFISILVGSSGILIGIAARPVIENMISGILITFTKPFSIGDTVEINNVYGIIEDITLTNTIIRIWNYNRYVLPNNKMINSEFTNYTLQDSSMWAHVEFYVSYEYDVNLIEKLAIESAQESIYFSGEEKPAFWIIGMENLNYKAWISAWTTKPSQAWEIKHDIRKNLIKKFKENGIKINQYNILSH